MSLIPSGLDLEKVLPPLLKMVGFGEAHRALIIQGVTRAVATVDEIDLRARQTDAIVRALAEKTGLDVAAILRSVDA